MKLKLLIWLILIAGFCFGIPERMTSLIADGYYSAQDLIQLFTASGFLAISTLLHPDIDF